MTAKMRILSGAEVKRSIEKTRAEYRADDFNNGLIGSLLAGVGCLVLIGLIMAFAVMFA